MDAIAAARVVFALFQKRYAEVLGRTRVWALPVGRADFKVDGLTPEAKQLGLNVLLHKDLLKPMAVGSYQLTEAGAEACLHPELVEEYLAPRKAMPPNTAVVVHGGHVQIGDGNTQNITYRAVLQKALDVAEERDDVPAPVAAALKRLQDFPDIESLMTEATERLTRK
jgi:hypothetical protein